MSVSTSDLRGMVRIGTVAGEQAELLLVDAETQRPIDGATAEAILEEDNEGYLVRVTKADGAYRPEVVRCRRGQARAVAMSPATPDVPARAVRVNQRVYDTDFVAETDLAGVTKVAEMEGRPEIVFAPSLDEAARQPGARFACYRGLLPGTLLALRSDGSKPADGTPVRVQARVVSTSGARRAGVPVDTQAVAEAAETRPEEMRRFPEVIQMAITAPDNTGTGKLTWLLDDPEGRVVGFDVGVDSVEPDKRVARDVRQFTVNVRKGEHFACVRPIFEGADLDPQLRCVTFDAPMAPAAPNVRVSVRVPEQGEAAVARKAVPVEVEVENVGDEDAPAFEVDVVISRDGRPESGLGEVRRVRVDGLRGKTKAVRRTDVLPPRDGAFFVVAQADALRRLRETNPEDNLGRRPLTVMPAGRNRAPVLSMAGTAATGASVVKGQAVKVSARAHDPEDGDLSRRITWWSSRDGKVGEGATIDTKMLSPGRHRVQARVADQGLPTAPASRDRRLRADRDLLPAAAPVYAAEAAEMVTAEVELEVNDPMAMANSSPKVSAGPDLTTTLGAEVVPLATAEDGDGDALSFTWSARAEDGTVVMLADGMMLRPRFKAPAAGTYRLTVEASDGKARETDFVEVKVLPPTANRAPQVTVMLPETGAAGMLARAAVTAADQDMDGLTVSYTLARPPGSTTLIVDGEGRMPGFVPDVGGEYVLTAEADDGRGGSATASAKLVVSGPMPPPDAGVPNGVDAAPMIVDAGMPLPVDAFVGPCDPLTQTGCAAGSACYLQGGNDMTTCEPAGTGTTGAACATNSQCAPGLQCVSGSCTPICTPRANTCPSARPACVTQPGSVRHGVCEPPLAIPDAGTPTMDAYMPPPPPDAYVPPPPPDAGTPTMDAYMPPPPPDAYVPPPPPDAFVAPSCNPVQQDGCGQAQEACYVETNGSQQCMLPGSGGEGAFCGGPNECAKGLGCHDGPDGRRCRPYCDIRAPACPSHSPMCAVLGGGPWGACQPVSGMDAGAVTASCNPVAQQGCARPDDACYLEPNGSQQCLLPGAGGQDALCAAPSDCAKGYGCFDGPDGRRCRPYCDQTNACPVDRPECVLMSGGPYGACFPFTGQGPPDAGPTLEEDAAFSEFDATSQI